MILARPIAFACLPLCLLLCGAVSAATPGPVGQNAAVTTDTVDQGGQRITVGNITTDQGIGGITGRSGGGTFTMLHGYIAQLIEDLPSINSLPNATPNPALVNQVVTFSIQIPPDMTVTWDFGDGTGDVTNQSTITHAYPIAATYNVAATVTNLDGETAIGGVAVIVKSVGTGVIGTPGDTDGDGVPDGLENLYGTDPNDPNSSPLPPGIVAQPLTVTKLQIKLNFAKPNMDSIQMLGKLPIPAGFTPLGLKVGVDIGGVPQLFILDAKGKSKTKTTSLMLRFKKAKKGKQVLAQTGLFSIRLIKGAFAPSFVDENMTGAVTVKKRPTNVNVTMVFENGLFTTVKTVLYTARQNKSGTAK